MLKYIIPSRMVQILKCGDFPPSAQLGFILLLALVKLIYGETSGYVSLNSGAADIVSAVSFLLAIFLAYSANGGRTGESFILRFVTLGSLLNLWVHFVSLITLLMATYGITYAFNGESFVSAIHKHFDFIYACISSVLYIFLVRRYFATFRLQRSPSAA